MHDGMMTKCRATEVDNSEPIRPSLFGSGEAKYDLCVVKGVGCPENEMLDSQELSQESLMTSIIKVDVGHPWLVPEILWETVGHC